MQGILHRQILESLNRASRLREALAAAPLFDEATLEPFRRSRVESLKQIEQTLTNLHRAAGDEALLWSEFADVLEKLRDIQEGSGPALLRFNRDDLFMTRLVRRICDEIGWRRPPLCVTNSQSYYFLSEGDVLFCPMEERFHLLSWPDIYHEIAHLAMDANGPLLHSQPVRFVEDFFAARGLVQPHLRRDFDRLRQLWTGDAEQGEGWYAEILADAIATYLCGRPYGLAHGRLVTVLNRNSAAPDPTHPSDHARTRAIELTLTRIRIDPADMLADWQSLRATRADRLPPDHDFLFPDELLAGLCDLAIEACRRIGLRACNDSIHAPKERSIANLLDRSWTRFREDPITYASVEHATVQSLFQELMT